MEGISEIEFKPKMGLRIILCVCVCVAVLMQILNSYLSLSPSSIVVLFFFFLACCFVSDGGVGLGVRLLNTSVLCLKTTVSVTPQTKCYFSLQLPFLVPLAMSTLAVTSGFPHSLHE